MNCVATATIIKDNYLGILTGGAGDSKWVDLKLYRTKYNVITVEILFTPHLYILVFSVDVVMLW
jgi:hypothetical protein